MVTPSEGAPSIAEIAREQRIVDELEALIGHAGTRALQGVYGGVRLHVPRAPDATHPLHDLLGEILLSRLARRFGGESIELPRPPQAVALRAWVLSLWAAGATEREIALATGRTERHVRRIVAEAVRASAMDTPGIELGRSAPCDGAPE